MPVRKPTPGLPGSTEARAAARRVSHLLVLMVVAVLPVQAVLAHGSSTLVRLQPHGAPVFLNSAADGAFVATLASAKAPAAEPPATALAAPITAAVADNSIAGIIRAAAIRHGADAVQLMRVASCESGLNPGAHNRWSGASGLFQFMPSTFYAHGGHNIWSAGEQADIAAAMFAAGWSYEWSCR